MNRSFPLHLLVIFVTRPSLQCLDGNSLEPYADTISCIRTKISFALLRSCVFCLRGCCALKFRVLSETSIRAVVEEGRLH